MGFAFRRLSLAILAMLLVGLAATGTRAQDRDSGIYAGIRAIGSIAEINDVDSTGFGGPQVTQNDTDQVAGPAAVIGYKFKPIPLRIEIEAGYRVRFDLDVRDLAPGGTVDYEIDVSTIQAVLNAIIEWRNTSDFTPYAGVTVGWARNRASTQRTVLNTQVQVNSLESKDNIALGLLAGVDWRFTQNWSAGLTYRFIDLGEVETTVFAGGDQITTGDYLSHDVLLSLLYHF